LEGLLLAAAQWLDAIGVGPWARGSGLVYPVANTFHLLGLVMLVGGIGVVDLRVAGLWRGLPIEPLSRALTPVAIVGLLIMVPSGTVLFAADGRSLAGSGIFHVKLVLIVLALTNAVAFRWRWGDRIGGWGGRVPIVARVMAVTSIALWLAVGTLGRWIAYG
jgi:hypothetical protein